VAVRKLGVQLAAEFAGTGGSNLDSLVRNLVNVLHTLGGSVNRGENRGLGSQMMIAFLMIAFLRDTLPAALFLLQQ
jgi:hypothetical protein